MQRKFHLNDVFIVRDTGLIVPVSSLLPSVGEEAGAEAAAAGARPKIVPPAHPTHWHSAQRALASDTVR